jgi:hypothetical protein
MPSTAPVVEPSARIARRLAEDPAVEAGSPDATYLGHRLLYQAGDESVDPLVNPRYLGAMAVRALFVFLIWVVGEIVISVVFFVLSAATAQDGTAVGAVVLLGFLVQVVWCLGLLCVYWLLPLPALVSEWKLAVNGKAPAAREALDHVAWVLREREAPLGTLVAERGKLRGQPDRTYLRVKEDIFSAFVSCFAFGDDLYIGWMLWIEMSPARWFLHWWNRMVRTLRLKGPAMYVTLRFDSARAMREVVHLSVREGVDVATGRREARGQGYVGESLTVEVDSEVPV